MPSQLEVRQAFVYDEITGNFSRRNRLSTGWLDNKGYKRVQFQGQSYPITHLIWKYVYGKFPAFQIDHINRVKTDNRLVNLRDVPQEINMDNTGPKKTSKSGIKGVFKTTNGKYWRVKHKGKYVGQYKTREQATSIKSHLENNNV